MKYRKFILKDYKAISGEVEIDLKKSLLPIIGINESGKTSILWGIFSFDSANDTLNGGRHIKNVGNLYKTTNRGEPSVMADIEIEKDELIDAVTEINDDPQTPAESKVDLKKFKRAISNWEGVLRINRVLSESKRT